MLAARVGIGQGNVGCFAVDVERAVFMVIVATGGGGRIGCATGEALLDGGLEGVEL